MRFLPFLFFLSPFIVSGQDKPFEVYGTITGKYKSKIYLFFENHYRQRDSLSSEIQKGEFYFRGNVVMPVLARLHMDQASLIGDFYIDSSRTYVTCKTNRSFLKNQ